MRHFQLPFEKNNSEKEYLLSCILLQKWCWIFTPDKSAQLQQSLSYRHLHHLRTQLACNASLITDAKYPCLAEFLIP